MMRTGRGDEGVKTTRGLRTIKEGRITRRGQGATEGWGLRGRGDRNGEDGAAGMVKTG